MKLSNLRDEDLRKISMLKTRKGCATSEAKRAQQILYSRNITHGDFSNSSNLSHIDMNLTRQYQSFEEVYGMSLEEYLLTGGK